MEAFRDYIRTATCARDAPSSVRSTLSRMMILLTEGEGRVYSDSDARFLLVAKAIAGLHSCEVGNAQSLRTRRARSHELAEAIASWGIHVAGSKMGRTVVQALGKIVPAHREPETLRMLLIKEFYEKLLINRSPQSA